MFQPTYRPEKKGEKKRINFFDYCEIGFNAVIRLDPMMTGIRNDRARRLPQGGLLIGRLKPEPGSN